MERNFLLKTLLVLFLSEGLICPKIQYINRKLCTVLKMLRIQTFVLYFLMLKNKKHHYINFLKENKQKFSNQKFRYTGVWNLSMKAG